MFKDIEINEITEDKKAGRMNITMSALTINSRGEWNKRGMTWLENYVMDNIDSIIGAPFVVSWMVDKEIPSSHGTLEYDENGECVFYDSDTVGSIQKAYLKDVEIDGVTSKKLIVEGYLYKQRYPLFCNWLKEQVDNNEHIKGSVEANGKGDSKNIIYEDGDGHNPDGSWTFGRTPKLFDLSALAILYLVPPADDGSEIIELNALQNTKSTEIKKSDDINDNEEVDEKKEEESMAEKNNDASIVELNNLIASQTTEINALKTTAAEKETELNALKEELNQFKTKETEINSLLVEANKTIESHKTQIAELNTEVEPLREMKVNAEKEKCKAEVNSYFESIKKENGFNDVEINSLTSFVEKCDIEGLKKEEAKLCVSKLKELKTLSKANVEVNSNEDTLFFSMKVENVETNSATDGTELFQ